MTIKRLLLLILCGFFALATNAQTTHTITKTNGTQILIPTYNAGDTLRIVGNTINDTLQISSYSDWKMLRDSTPIAYHLKLETKNKEVPTNAFQYCATIQNAIMPNIQTIGTQGFFISSLKYIDCPLLTTVMSAGLSYTALENIVFLKLTTAYTGAFHTNTQLKTVKLPLLDTIEEQSFFGCTSLETVELPQVIKIKDHSFRSCNNLKTFLLGKIIPEVTTIAFGSVNTALQKIIFFVPANAVNNYRQSTLFLWNTIPDKNIMSRDMLAEEAYLYGLPLVLMDITRRQMTDTTIAAKGKAPINQFAHNDIFPTADFTAVVRPNNDTYYSSAWLDLSTEPMVLSMPATNNRYHLMPMLDAYTNVFASPGARTTGYDTKKFMIAGPAWNGTKPLGIDTVFQSPTNMVWIAGRTQVNSPQDGQNIVSPLMHQYDLRPLSQIFNPTYTPPTGIMDPSVPRKAPNDTVANMPIHVFFNYLNQLMVNNPPLTADSSTLKRFAFIGVGPGLVFDTTIFTQAEKDSIPKIPGKMLQYLKEYISPIAKSVNNWGYSLNNTTLGRTIGLGMFDTAYTLRAQTAYMGLGANLAEDAIYYSCTKDTNSEVLKGNKSYILHIPKGQQPPVNAFWSLTLYDKKGNFSANDSNRYTLGNRSSLDTSADGSINIYIQHENPGKKNAPNWLPAPTDTFNLMIRAYFPEENALKNQWQPRAIHESIKIEVFADTNKVNSILNGISWHVKGSNPKFTFSVKQNYKIDSIFINGNNIPDSIAGGSYTFNNVTTNQNIRLVFMGVPTLNLATKTVLYNGQAQNVDSVKIKLNNIEIGKNNWVSYKYFLNGIDQNGRPKNAGTYKVVGYFAGNDTLLACQSDSATFTITPKAVTVTPHPKTKVYGEADPTLSYTLSPALLGSDNFSGALTRQTGENVGKYEIQQGTLSAGNNYTIAYVKDSLAITPKAVTVTAHPKTKVYGDADPTLTYTFNPALLGSDNFSGALARQTIENVGKYEIRQGTLSAGNNYSITYVKDSLTITPKAVTVTAHAKTKVYGEADPTLTYTCTPTLSYGDVFTGTLSRIVGNNVGKYPIQQGTLALSNNYTLTYNKDTLSIMPLGVAVTANPKTKVYGNADPVLTYTPNPATLPYGDAFTGALSRVSGNNVGKYPIQQGTLALSNNYTLTYNKDTLSITPLVVAVTANPKTKVYGDADPTLTYTFNPALLGSDSFSGTLTRQTGENVGKYHIQQGTLSAGNNYTITYVKDSLIITSKAITVTADPKTKIYGNADPALTYTVNPATLPYGDVFTGALSRAVGNNVGKYPIQQGTLALNNNYTLTYHEDTLRITPLGVAVTADPKTKIYGDADPALTYTVNPTALPYGDVFTGALSRAVGNNVGKYPIQQGTLALNNNYTLTYLEDTLRITQLGVIVTADPKTKVYGDADPALTYTVNPTALPYGDVFTGTLSRVSGNNVGKYPIQQGTLAANSNYNLIYVADSFSIEPKAITVNAIAETIDFGQTPVLGYNITTGSLLNGDTFNGTLAVNNLQVGAHNIMQGTLTAGSNYTLTYHSAILTIRSVDKSITDIKIDGIATHRDTSIFSIVSDCESNSVSVMVNADLNASLTIGGQKAQPNTAVVLNLPNYGINTIPVTVTAQNGNSQNYTLEISKPIPSTVAYYKRFDNLLIVPTTVAGITVTTVEWYKDGIRLDRDVSKGYLEIKEAGNYSAIINGNIHICETAMQLRSSGTFNVQVIPNPISVGQQATVKVNCSNEELSGARIQLYNISGQCLSELPATGNETIITIPVQGTILVKVISERGTTETKIIVK